MAAFQSQRLAISQNHGIKPENFTRMFIPLGLNEDDINESLLIQLGSVGVRRGDLVHKGSTVSLPLVRDPFTDENKDIEALLIELEAFDLKMQSKNLYLPEPSDI